MADLLSAVSLLLALVGIVYGVWYPYIAETLNMEVPHHLADAEPHRRRLNHVISMRARPLAYSAVALVLILLPEAIPVVLGTVRTIADYGLHAYPRYDPVAACLLLVTILSLLFAGHLVREVRQLKELRKSLSEE